MAKTVKQYMVKVFAFMVKSGMKEIEDLPEHYQVPVAEYLAAQEAQ